MIEAIKTDNQYASQNLQNVKLLKDHTFNGAIQSPNATCTKHVPTRSGTKLSFLVLAKTAEGKICQLRLVTVETEIKLIRRHTDFFII